MGASRPHTWLARAEAIQVRLSVPEVHALEAIGRRMIGQYSDVRKMDGTINTSAVVRYLIQEERARRGNA